MGASPCPGCPTGVRDPGKYLCLGCWNSLPAHTRRALKKRGRQAIVRLRELHRQLDGGVPLHQIEVTA